MTHNIDSDYTVIGGATYTNALGEVINAPDDIYVESEIEPLIKDMIDDILNNIQYDKPVNQSEETNQCYIQNKEENLHTVNTIHKSVFRKIKAIHVVASVALGVFAVSLFKKKN